MFKRLILATLLTAVFTLAGISLVASQQQPSRIDDRQVGTLLSRIDAGITTFRASFDRSIDRSPINGSRTEDGINESMNDFKQAADRTSSLQR